MKIALIDYGAGNLHSCSKALERALAADSRAGQVIVGSDPDVIARADRIVLPGMAHSRIAAMNWPPSMGLNRPCTRRCG